MTKIRVAGASVTQTGVIVYLESGEELNLTKDTKQTADILDQLVANHRAGQIVEINIETFEVYTSIEEKTNGAVRFVRGTLAKLKSIFGAEPDAEPELYNLGSVRPRSIPVMAQAAIGEGDLHAVVAGKVIPVAGLERHIEAAAETPNAIGLQRFLERIATVIDKRGHTVDELMNFMKHGDLPIADDGCIVAYKVLKTGSGVFVDCRSGNVKQKVGSFVQMDEKLVDPSRRTECSTGLHIARRGYLRHFPGNIITLVKVAPEDVIAVPKGEPDKMRARGYHVVGRLPSEVHATLRANKPMTDHKQASQMLADVIAGNHVGILEIVNIGGEYGANLTITPADGKKVHKRELGKSGEVAALPETAKKAEVEKQEVSIRELRKKIDAKYDAEQAKVSEAAKTGDMSAAINPKQVEQKMGRIKRAATPKPIPVVVDHVGKIDKKALALKLHAEGKSNRAIEAELHICRKTLKKLFDKHGLKPNG